jgi:hypothetical protein
MKTLLTTTHCLALLLLGITVIDAVAAEATPEPEAIDGGRASWLSPHTSSGHR